jgi:peroxiredoxin/uncharacterized membrane protein YphA (DoxX/SURF4 family)
MSSVDTVVLVLRIVLAVVFATAGVGKLLDREGSVSALRDFGLGGSLAEIGGRALPVAELAVALALLFPVTATAGAVGAVVLLLAFIGGISAALLRGDEPDCHCFGQIHSAPAGPSTLARNGVLGALAVVAAVAGPGPSISGWIGDRSAAELVSIALGLAALAAVAAAVRLWLENRQLRTVVAQAEAGFPQYGLPIGTPAPKFSLRSTSGEKVTLDGLLARGKPIVIVFIGASCGPCWVLMPHLNRWQEALADSLSLVMIGTGTRRQNEDAIDEHGLGGAFLHNGYKVMEAYRGQGTPTAVAISPDGLIASHTVVGARPIEPLVRSMLNGAGSNGAVDDGVAQAIAAAN